MTTAENASENAAAPPRPRYDDAALDALSTQGDPLADETVAALFHRGEVGDFNTLMRFFTTAGDPLPARLPASARTYFEATALPPAWVDWDVMEQARLFFMDNAAHINTGLSFAAMPVSYAVPRMARLLSSTHSLAYPSRRMANTGQFVTYLMRTDAFADGSKFVPAAQKVRLLHAAVRHHLRHGGHWDVERDGTPICQEDMIAGQTFFSLLVLDAMHRLGIHMSEEGAEAYYYAWRVVAAMLGCDLSAVPEDLAEARAYCDLYLLRHLGPSPRASAWARSCCGCTRTWSPARSSTRWSRPPSATSSATPSATGWRSRAAPGTRRPRPSRCSWVCWRPSRTAARSRSGRSTRRARCSPASSCPR